MKKELAMSLCQPIMRAIQDATHLWVSLKSTKPEQRRDG